MEAHPGLPFSLLKFPKKLSPFRVIFLLCLALLVLLIRFLVAVTSWYCLLNCHLILLFFGIKHLPIIAQKVHGINEPSVSLFESLQYEIVVHF